MTQITIYRNSNHDVERFTCSGHAGYADYGNDIVCASFSTMIITTINQIINIDDTAISYTDTNNLKIINIKKDNITNSLLNTLVELMYELRDNYDKNIDIKEESHD